MSRPPGFSGFFAPSDKPSILASCWLSALKDEAGVWGECNERQYRNRTRQTTVVLIKLQEYESNGSSTIAQVAKSEVSQSEDMNVPGSSPGLGVFLLSNSTYA
jgi:hypothetical protein